MASHRLNTVASVLEDQSGASDYDPAASDWRVIDVVWLSIEETIGVEQVEGEKQRSLVNRKAISRRNPSLQVGRRLQTDEWTCEIATLIDEENRGEYVTMDLAQT